MTHYQLGDRLISRQDDHELHGIYIGNDQVITYPTLPSTSYRPYNARLMSIKEFSSQGALSLCLHEGQSPSPEYVVNRALSTLIDTSLVHTSSEEFADWCFKINYPVSTSTNSPSSSVTNDVVDIALQTATLAIPFVSKKGGLFLGIGIGIASAINQMTKD
ncbi:hypothetical protein [Thalassolituus oleivorans]|uniref:hypothetical protein n=1 Tax=Thalassolituus oleivorans TaxID=187493 RepID=UPI001CE2750D|nr:hypothetical protein [Thalassolituus oleivorans]MCA6127298.1 hypothetical protein [Thalassolituus oleivorans 4BN06-13]